MLPEIEIVQHALSCILLAFLCNTRISASLSAFAEWFPLRSNEPYCVIALLTYTTAEKYLDPIKGIRHKGGARACIAIRPTLSSIRMVRAFRMLKIILTG